MKKNKKTAPFNQERENSMNMNDILFEPISLTN